MFFPRVLPSSRHFLCVSFYRRRLPHIQPADTPLFITWHLHGSVPYGRFAPPGDLRGGKAFVWMDRHLDQAAFGPTWLKREEIAKVVVDALRHGADTLHHYGLHAFVVMANHVHVLLTPLVPAPKLLRSVKGFSAREANKVLGRTGEPFWQSESYDRWVRNDVEFGRIERYIVENPVRAGLVSAPGEYRWSSAYAGTNAGMARQGARSTGILRGTCTL